MEEVYPLSQFLNQFPDNDSCLMEITRQRFPNGIFCYYCEKVTKHYRLSKRKIYACKFCRSQISPLKGTIFEKSPTPLKLWFLALFLMTQTRDMMTCKQLQNELGVTYKTAWRIHTQIRIQMEQDYEELLEDPEKDKYRERKWVFFNKLEIKVVNKQEHITGGKNR